jgi:hypothetical protein
VGGALGGRLGGGSLRVSGSARAAQARFSHRFEPLGSAQPAAAASSCGWPHVAAPSVLPMPASEMHAPCATPAAHADGTPAHGAEKPLAQHMTAVSGRTGAAGIMSTPAAAAANSAFS